MEKFQIAKYGMMQVAAIVYCILVCGAVVKWNKPYAEDGMTMPAAYYYALFFKDYGIYLLLFVIGWTALVSYLLSSYCSWDFDGDHLALTGLALAIILVAIGTFLAGAALLHPVNSI